MLYENYKEIKKKLMSNIEFFNNYIYSILLSIIM